MPEVLTASQAAELLGVDKRTVLRFVRAGRLRSYPTPGGQHRFRRGDVERLAGGQSDASSRPSASTIQNKRDEIEALNLEVQARRAKRELDRIEAEDAEPERAQADARRRAELEAARAQREGKEAARRERADRLRQRQQRDWEARWVNYALRSLPNDAPLDVRPAVNRMTREALADLAPADSDSTVSSIVDAAVRQALAPWERAREVEQIIENALNELPFAVRTLSLQRHFGTPPTDWEARAQQDARRAIGALPPGSSLTEIRYAATEAVKNVARQYRQQEAQKEHQRLIECAMAWVSDGEEREAVRQALERLHIGCGSAQMERAKEAAIAPIRERERAAAETRRKETQAGRDADRYLWRVTEYIEALAEAGNCDLGLWDRSLLGEKLKNQIRPKFIQLLLRGELDADEARELIEETVDREL